MPLSFIPICYYFQQFNHILTLLCFYQKWLKAHATHFISSTMHQTQTHDLGVAKTTQYCLSYRSARQTTQTEIPANTRTHLNAAICSRNEILMVTELYCTSQTDKAIDLDANSTEQEIRGDDGAQCTQMPLLCTCSSHKDQNISEWKLALLS